MNKLLFPTTTVGSMPRPKYIKNLIEQETIGNEIENFQYVLD